MKNTRIPTFLAVIAISAFASMSQAKEANQNETIRIGLSGPFSGGSSPMGISMRNGVRMAVQEINSTIGGINGHKIELIERDDEAKNEVGAQIADELIQKKVVATIGVVNTGVGLASIDAYQKAKVPLMIAVATGTALTKKYAPPAASENYIFRVSPTLDMEAKVLATELKKNHLFKVAILADATAYGAAGIKAFKEQGEAAGLIITSEERFNIGDKNMSKQVSAAKESGAQALVMWGIGPELAAIAKNKEALGWKVPLFGSWTLSMLNFSELAGSSGDGARMPLTFIPDFGSSTKNYFLNSYIKQFNTDKIPSAMSAAQGYDGMFLLFYALLQANSTNGQKIKEALENLSSRYEGVITKYISPFSKNDHDAISQNMFIMGKLNQGRIDYSYHDDETKGFFIRKKAAK